MVKRYSIAHTNVVVVLLLLTASLLPPFFRGSIVSSKRRPVVAVTAFSPLSPSTRHRPFVAVTRPNSNHNNNALEMSSSSTTTSSIDVSQFMTGARPAGTSDYVMQQTMIRIKDPTASLKFYCDILGFKLVMYREFPQWGFNVYFVAPVDAATIPSDPDKQWQYCMNLPGCIELTWNHGSEQEDGRVYHTGNADTAGTADGSKVRGGFGHLGITVPDVYAACDKFKSQGCEFTKTPNSGGMKGLAFMKDPDGYLIEILPQGPMITKDVDCDGVTLDGGDGYKDNSK